MRLFLKEDVIGGLGAEDFATLGKTLRERQDKRRKKFEESLKGGTHQADEGSFGGIAQGSLGTAPPGYSLPSYSPVSTVGSEQAFQRVGEATDRYAGALGALGQVQAPVPERRELNDTMLGVSAGADALRDIVSTLPAKFRDFRPTVDRYRDLETQRLSEEFQKGQIETENLERRLGANVEAERARLEGALKGTDFALGQEAAARGEAQFQYGAGFDVARFSEQVRQFGLGHALALAADGRDAESTSIRNALAKNPYAFVSEQAEAVKDQFGGDAGKAKAALMSDLVLGSQINQATLDKLLAEVGMTKAEFERKQALWKLLTPKKEAQHALWQMEFEIKEGEKRLKLLDAQIGSANRANRDTAQPDPMLSRQLSEIDTQVERLRAKVDAFDKTMAEEKAKYPDVDHSKLMKERNDTNAQVRKWKDKANKIKPGWYPD